MPINIIGGTDGITVETDPTALKLTGGAVSGDLTVAQQVGLGGVIPTSPNDRIAIHNGHIVMTAGFGVRFGDGTNIISTSNLALLSGATFSGKVNVAPTAGVAGINIGVGGTDTASVTAGDLWIVTGGSTLNYRDGNGNWRILASRNLANTFSFPQTITASDGVNPMLSVTQNGNGGGLRITNNGTGYTMLVEDSTNPDSSPFVVANNGQTVIGGLTPYSTASLTVNGGASIESGSYYVRVDSGGVAMYGQLVLANQTTASHSNAFTSYANEVAVTINGSTRYIPYR